MSILPTVGVYSDFLPRVLRDVNFLLNLFESWQESLDSHLSKLTSVLILYASSVHSFNKDGGRSNARK